MTAVPDPVNVTFGALVEEPPAVLPNVTVLVIAAEVVKPPVPVLVKPVAVAMDNTVVPAVVCARTILPAPNVIERVFELSELNIPVVNVNPANANVPAVNVYVQVAVANVNAAPNVTVPAVCVNEGVVIVPPL